MRFDLTDLRVYLEACGTGSMTEAAARCSLTLAAVSARIRALEGEAGTPLLLRHARGVRPTPAGEALARHARLVLHQAEALRRDLAPRPSGQERPVILLANSSSLLRPLHRAVAEVAQAHPSARILLRESGSEATVHALHAGAADLGVVSDAVAVEGLACEVLGPDPLVLAVPRGHALAARDHLAFAEVLSQDLVAWDEGSALHLLLVLQAFRVGQVLAPRFAAPTAAGVLELVARGLGVAVLPLELVARDGAVIAIPLEDAWARRRLLLCRRPQEDSPLVRALERRLGGLWTDGPGAAPVVRGAA